MSSAYLHPEFGYFCPSPGLRRAVRVAVAFTVIGALAGAGGIAALVTDHEPNLDSAAMTAHAEAGSVDRQPDPSQSSMVKPEASPIVAIAPDRIKAAAKLDSVKSEAVKSQAAKSEPANAEAKSDTVKFDAAMLEIGRSSASKIDAAKADATATAPCEGNTWAYLDGTCGSGQVRKMRVVRAPAVSRAGPSSVGASASVAPVAGAPAGRTSTPAKSSPSVSTQAPAAVATAARSPEPSQQPVAGRKKPQKTASSPNRRREQAAGTVPPPRPEPTGPVAFGPFGPGGFLGLLR